jgi:hypothetical protein
MDRATIALSSSLRAVQCRMKTKWYYSLIFALYGGTLLLWVGITLAVLAAAGRDWPKASSISSTFGAASALFSGLAFVGVIHAILLQKSELALQREELRLQRAEFKQSRKQLRRSADAQQKSEEALREQVNVQFFTAYLNAIRDMSAFADITKRSYSERDAHDKIACVIAELDRQANTLLGIQIPATPPWRHVSECLDILCNRLDTLQSTSPHIDGYLPSDVRDRLVELVDDFDRLRDGRVMTPLGEAFCTRFGIAYLFAIDMKEVVINGAPIKEVLDHIDCVRDEFEDLRKLCVMR